MVPLSAKTREFVAVVFASVDLDVDWRDLLMAVGFAHDPAAHERYKP